MSSGVAMLNPRFQGIRPLQADAPIAILGEAVIANENKPRHRNFPNLALLQNGDLLVVYGVSADHQRSAGGVLVSRRSSDQGKTWQDPQPILAFPGRHYSTTYNMTQLSDGRIILHVWEWRFRKPEDGPAKRVLHSKDTPPRRPKVIRTLNLVSTDNGMTWSEPVHYFHPFFVGWQYSYGRRYELENGKLMLPLYGPVREGLEEGVGETPSTFPGEAWAMTVAFSEDGGLTYPEFSVVASEPAEGHLFNETDILRLRDGRFLAILRNEKSPRWSYRSYSSDGGRPWTRYALVNFKGQCPCLVQLRSGTILCAYRDVEPGRPGISVSISQDEGISWRWVGQLYSGANTDCGYPVIVRLMDGRLFCIYYTSFVDGDCEVRGMWLSDDG